MTSIFHYNTLKTSLKSKTKTLIIELNRPDQNQAINSEMVFELESIFAWASSHIEINSILLTSNSDCFSSGFDKSELKKLDNQKIQKLLAKLQRLIYSMFFLPQTVIVDLKQGASGIGAELAIGADIRIARTDTQIAFDHLKKGLVPACGGIGFLGTIVPVSFSKYWVLTSESISTTDLLNSGLIQKLYTSEESETVVNNLLDSIASQAPVPRIQAKRSLLEAVMPELDRALNFEHQLADAAMCTEDWKRYIENSSFIPAKEFAKILQSSNNSEMA